MIKLASFADRLKEFRAGKLDPELKPALLSWAVELICHYPCGWEKFNAEQRFDHHQRYIDILRELK